MTERFFLTIVPMRTSLLLLLLLVYFLVQQTEGTSPFGLGTIYSTPDSYTYTFPVGTVYIYVFGTGAGGGGGAGDTNAGGGAGGAATYRYFRIVVTPAFTNCTVTIGASALTLPRWC